MPFSHPLSPLFFTLTALLLGMLHALCFAPGPLPAALLPWLQLLIFSTLMGCLLRCPTLRRATWLGACFGVGNFCTGLYWLFISLHTYGGLAAPLAALAVFLFCAAMTLYYALAAGWTHACLSGLAQDARHPTPRSGIAATRVALLTCAGVASGWAVSEWLRGTLLTGFPWLSLGYAHVDGPLSAWAALVGVYGLGWMAAFLSISLALGWAAFWQVGQRGKVGRGQPGPSSDSIGPLGRSLRTTRCAPLACSGLAVLLLLAGGWMVRKPWTQPHGEPLRIRLVQGNIPQSEKFDVNLMQHGLERYMQLALSPTQPNTPSLHAILLPETVMTLFQDSYPPQIWASWQAIARAQNATLLLGSPLRQTASGHFTNSVLGLHADSSLAALLAGRPALRYDKHHLVPFGEFVPRGFRWFVDALNIPLGDFHRGSLNQPALALSEQRLALSICYEDLFGEEVLPSVHPHDQNRAGATLLANVSNLGWFGHSWALRQHLQIARMRTLETARPMVRAANTGISAFISADGQVQAHLPAHTQGVLDVSVQGRSGLTPYARWGNRPVLLLSCLIGVFVIRRLQRSG